MVGFYVMWEAFVVSLSSLVYGRLTFLLLVGGRGLFFVLCREGVLFETRELAVLMLSCDMIFGCLFFYVLNKRF